MTPTARFGAAHSVENRKKRTLEGLPLTLNDQVAEIGERLTRTASGGALSKEAFERRKAQGLPMTINFQVGGRLNPDWVEQLMGYPHGWTDPECDEVTPWAGWPAGYGAEQYVFEYPRTTQGMKNRAARLKALGNSVVPQQAQFLFDAIARLNNLAEGV